MINLMLKTLSDDGKKSVQSSSRNLKILNIIMLITLLTSACASIGGGDNGLDQPPIVTDDGGDGDDDQPKVTITATPSHTPTVIPTFTATLPPTDVPPTLTPETVDRCIVGEKGESLERPSAVHLVELAKDIYDHTPTDVSVIDVNPALGMQGNKKFTSALQDFLGVTEDGVIPDFCTLRELVTEAPLVLDSYTRSGENPPVFSGGKLVITRGFIDELNRASLSVYIVMNKVPPSIITTRIEFIPYALGINLDTTGFYENHPDGNPDLGRSNVQLGDLLYFPSKPLTIDLGNVQFMVIGSKGLSLTNLLDSWPLAYNLFYGRITQLVTEIEP